MPHTSTVTGCPSLRFRCGSVTRTSGIATSPMSVGCAAAVSFTDAPFLDECGFTAADADQDGAVVRRIVESPRRDGLDHALIAFDRLGHVAEHDALRVNLELARATDADDERVIELEQEAVVGNRC